MNKEKILKAINDGNFGCHRESVIKLMEAVVGEPLEEKPIYYPCLKISPSGTIIIVTEKGSSHHHFCGTILNSELDNHVVSPTNVKNNTHNGYDFDIYQPFKGRVILTQDDYSLRFDVERVR